MADHLVGSFVVDATPDAADVAAGRVPLAGYVARTAPAARIAAPLSTRALVVDDGAGGVVALVTLDVCAVEHSFVDQVRTRVGDATGVRPEAVLVTATHTHSAPVTRPFPVFSEDAAVPDPGYLARLADGAVNAVAHAFADRRPARLFLGRGSSAVAFNRHRAGGAHDDVLDVLQAVADDTGDTIAVAFLHGCHPVSEPDLSVVSPDFPGPARDGVEAVFGGDALYVQGFAGTANPRPGVDVGASLAADVGSVLAGHLVRLRGPVRVTGAAVELAMRPPPSQAAVEELRRRLVGELDLQSRAARRWCDLVLDGAAADRVRTELRTVRVGPWRLVACSHEVVGEWAPAVRALWDEPLVSLTGYTGGVDCYLPTAAILGEAPDEEFPLHASYEGCTSFLYYGLATRFAASVDTGLLGAVDLLDGHVRRAASRAVADGDGAAVLVRTPDGAACGELPTPSGPVTWTALPGGIGGRPAVVRAVNGALAAFARGTDGALQHAWQVGPEREWVPWVSLGGDLHGDVAALVALDGRLAALAPGDDGALLLAAQTAPLAGWGGWAEVAGGPVADPVAATAAGGEVVVAARAPDGPVLALALPPGLDGASAWEEVLPGPGGPPVLAPDGAGGAVVGAVDEDGELVAARRTRSGAWGAPVRTAGRLTGRPALAVTADGTVTAVARGRDDALHAVRLAPGAVRWGAWAPLGGSVADDPELVVVASGALWAVAAGPDGAWRVATVPARPPGPRRSTSPAP